VDIFRISNVEQGIMNVEGVIHFDPGDRLGDEMILQRVTCNEGMAPKRMQIELHNSQFLVRHSTFKAYLSAYVPSAS
jgi:hypothetical protein